jgi:ribosomal protein L19E
MQKVEGVQAVRVSLNDGLTILDLKPGNAITLAKLRQIIKNNGFVSKDVSVIARGRPRMAHEVSSSAGRTSNCRSRALRSRLRRSGGSSYRAPRR